MRVGGLDLSLDSTGVATLDNGGGVVDIWTGRLRPGKLRGHPRLRMIHTRAVNLLNECDLVLVEGPSYASIGTGQHERGGLWWIVTHVLWRQGVKLIVVPPSSLKKYATGKGGAHKDEVLAAVVRRYKDCELTGNDEADALTLAAMGADYHGWPIVEVPKLNRTALDKWPWDTEGML